MKSGGRRDDVDERGQRVLERDGICLYVFF